MVLGQLDWCRQKSKTKSPIYTMHQNNSKCLKDLNISHDTIKVLEGKTGRKISCVPCTNIFVDISPKVRDRKEKI